MNKLPTCEEERINEIGSRYVYLVQDVFVIRVLPKEYIASFWAFYYTLINFIGPILKLKTIFRKFYPTPLHVYLEPNI